MEQKVAASEAEATKVFEEMKKWNEVVAKKDDEIKCLENVIRNNIAAISRIEIEKTELQKNIKSEEKEVSEIEKSNKGHQITIKALKKQFNQQLEVKDDTLNKLAKKNKDLEEKVDSLLDLLYGCNDCGRFGDSCECDELEGDNIESSPPDQHVFHQPSPPPVVTSVKPDVHPLTSSTTHPTMQYTWWSKLCFGCTPPLTIPDTPPCTKSPSRTPPGTPPPLRCLCI